MFNTIKCHFLHQKLKNKENIFEHVNRGDLDIFVSFLWNKNKNIIINNADYITSQHKLDLVKTNSISHTNMFMLAYSAWVKNKNMETYYVDLFKQDKKHSVIDMFYFFIYCDFFNVDLKGKVFKDLEILKNKIVELFLEDYQLDTFIHKQLTLKIAGSFCEGGLFQEHSLPNIMKELNSLPDNEKQEVISNAYHKFVYHRLITQISKNIGIDRRYRKLSFFMLFTIFNKTIQLFPAFNFYDINKFSYSCFEDMFNILSHFDTSNIAFPTINNWVDSIIKSNYIPEKTRLEILNKLITIPTIQNSANIHTLTAKIELVALQDIIQSDSQSKRKRL